MSDDLVKLEVSDDLIKNIVSRQVSAALTERDELKAKLEAIDKEKSNV